MSKHGGSPESGLVPPVGTDTAKLAPGASMVLEPAVSQEIREREARKRNFERRRIALELLPSCIAEGQRLLQMEKTPVGVALEIADELISATGGEL